MSKQYQGLAELTFGGITVPLEIRAQTEGLDSLVVRRLILNTIRRDYRPDHCELALRDATQPGPIAHQLSLDLDPMTFVPAIAGTPITAKQDAVVLLDEAMVDLVTHGREPLSATLRQRLFTALETAANLLDDMDTLDAVRVHAQVDSTAAPVTPDNDTTAAP